MNWEAVGAIGEIIGAIAVVVTLIYLAGQLRQNTMALRSASYEHWNLVTNSWADFMAQYADQISEIRNKSSYDELSASQQTVLNALFVRTTEQAQTAFLQYRAGTLDDDVFAARLRGYIEFITIFPFFRQQWTSGLMRFLVPEFAEYIESMLPNLDRLTLTKD